MKQRELNFELLRILAMLMVLGLHANYKTFQWPTPENVMTTMGLTRVLLQCACIVAVNVFVMISGWFGINASVRGFCNFMWQVTYMVALMFIVGVLFFDVPVSYTTLPTIVGLRDGGGWFTASYIGLYILSPMLNHFIANTEPRKIAYVLVAFFAFEFLWNDSHSVGFICDGYSTFSFIGLYVLAGLLRKVSTKYSARTWFEIYLATVVCAAILCTIAFRLGYAKYLLPIISNYISPLVIIGATALLLTFSKLTVAPASAFVRRGILWLAASCYAAYLLHCGGFSYAFSLYTDGVLLVADSVSAWLSLPAIIAYILGVFMLAVVIDQPRRLIWKHLLLPRFK